MKRRAFILATMLAGSMLTASILGGGTALAADKPTIAVVAKVGGIPWFNAMEKGIKEQGEALGVEAYMIGPTSADPAHAGPRAH